MTVHRGCALYAIGDIMLEKGNLIGNARQDHDVNILDSSPDAHPYDQRFKPHMVHVVAGITYLS
jgi:hypothetical protein